jgi:hypothetical protein
MSTIFALMNSLRNFPNTSYVAFAVTPRSKWSCTKKCTAQILGNSIRSIFCPRNSSAISSTNLSVLSSERSQSHSSAWRTKKPALQFEPLSPARPRTTCPSGASFVGPKESSETGFVGAYDGCWKECSATLPGGGTSIVEMLVREK